MLKASLSLSRSLRAVPPLPGWSGKGPSATRRRAFAVLFAASMITAAGNTAMQTVLPPIGRSLGAPDAVVVMVFSLSSIAWTVSAPVWARISDVRGRKPLVMLGLLGFSVSMLAFGAMVVAGERRWLPLGAVIVGLVVSRAVFGLFGSAATPASQAYVADRTGPEERTEALATLASAFGLGTVLGPALAPFFLLPYVGLAGPMLVFTLIGAAGLVAVGRLLPRGDAPMALTGERPTRAAVAPAGRVWRDRRILPYLVWGFVLASAQAVNAQVLGFQVIDVLRLQPLKAQGFIGVAMLAGAAATLAAQWGLIRLLRLSPRDLMLWGAGLACVGNLMAGFGGDYNAVVAGFAVMSAGYGFCRPGFTAGASLSVGPEAQGATAGALASVNGAAYLASPVLGVALYQALPAAPFLVNGLLLAGLMAAALRVPALQDATGRASQVADQSPAG